MSLDIHFEYNRGREKRKITSVIYKDQYGDECRIYDYEFPKYFSGEQISNLEIEEDVIERVFSSNITHNLCQMAREAGIYDALWRPYRLHPDYSSDLYKDYDGEMKFESSVEMKAKEIVPFLEKGLHDLKKRPNYFKKFNSPNGWGVYENFVPFVSDVLRAAKKHPESIIYCSR